MAEWSQLPRELIELIAKRLNSEIDFLRFRSVCSAWRSSVSEIPYNAYPSRFPVIPNDGVTDTSWGFKLSKRPIYLVASPKLHSQTAPSGGWIIELDRELPNRVRLLNPLSRAQLTPFPSDFPQVLDISRYRIHELGFEYTLQYIKYRPLATSICDPRNLYMEKVAFCLEKGNTGFVLLTIHISGKLVVYRSGDSKWTVINDSTAPYDDVIAIGGRFYAVDGSGRAVVLNLDSESGPELNAVAHSVFGGDKKYLVESDGDLLMIDKYLEYDGEFEFYEEFDSFISESTLKFKVYRLDEDEEKWVELASLGNRIVFLGDNCAFSASVSELNSVCKGNCLVFSDHFCNQADDGVPKIRGIGVFDLENGSICPISSYTGYSELFWPPPDWFCSDSPIEVSCFSCYLVLLFSLHLWVVCISLALCQFSNVNILFCSFLSIIIYIFVSTSFICKRRQYGGYN